METSEVFKLKEVIDLLNANSLREKLSLSSPVNLLLEDLLEKGKINENQILDIKRELPLYEVM
jgi:hypothetical protein